MNAYNTSVSIDWTKVFCIYKTTVLLERICWPTSDIIKTLDGGNGTFSKKLQSSVNTDALAQWFNDLKEGWKVVAGSVGFAVLIGLIYMVFLRIFSGLIVWLVIIAYLILMAVLGGVAYQKFKMIDSNQTTDAQSSSSDGNLGSNTDSNKDTYRITAYVLWGICGLSAIGVLCYFNKIRLAIAIIKTATLYIIDVPLTLLVPPIFSVFVACWWVFWIIAMVYLYSDGVISKSESTPFATVKHTQ